MASVHRLGRPIREEVKEQGEEQEQGNEEPKYQPLNVLGGILEKGYGDGESKFKAVSLPQPSVRPFPVARHRSEGPVCESHHPFLLNYVCYGCQSVYKYLKQRSSLLKYDING